MIKTLTFRTYGYLTYYITITHASPPPTPPPAQQNLPRAQFLKGIVMLIFAGSGELQKTVLLLERPQEVKLRFFFHST